MSDPMESKGMADKREVLLKLELLSKNIEQLTSNVDMMIDRLSSILALPGENKSEDIAVSSSNCKLGEILQMQINKVVECNFKFDCLFRYLQI